MEIMRRLITQNQNHADRNSLISETSSRTAWLITSGSSPLLDNILNLEMPWLLFAKLPAVNCFKLI